MKHIFTINKPNIKKMSNYQQYFQYFVACKLVPYTFWLCY